MMLISEKEARDIARPFGEGVARLVLALGPKLTGDPLDEIERQLDALIDGAPLIVSEHDIPAIRELAREVAGSIIIAMHRMTPEEGIFILDQNDHLTRICKLIGDRVAA